MCSRYVRWITLEEIGEFEEFSDFQVPPEPLAVTYNAAPQSVQPIIRLADTAEPTIALAQWGLIPSWARDFKIGQRTINARAEDLLAKPSFRDSVKTKRCLIPANCFYEWREKQPYAIGMQDGRPFCFAGLWDRWRNSAGVTINSFTVITTAPNDLIQPLHDRMPCILPRAAYLRWMNAREPINSALNLLRPYPAEQMRAWRVGKAVGNVRNDNPGLVQELAVDEPNESHATLPLWNLP